MQDSKDPPRMLTELSAVWPQTTELPTQALIEVEKAKQAAEIWGRFRDVHGPQPRVWVSSEFKVILGEVIEACDRALKQLQK